MTWISVTVEYPPLEPILTTDGKYIHVAYPNRDTDRWYTGCGTDCYYCGGQPDCSDRDNVGRFDQYIFTHCQRLPELPSNKCTVGWNYPRGYNDR